MNYEKKYKDALERMKSWAKGEHPECFSEAQKTAEFIFPELKESEGDRMRKNLYKCLRYYVPNDIAEEYIKWLEKQGEKMTKPKFNVGDWIVFNGLILHIDEIVNGYYRTTSIGDGIHNSYDWDIDNAARLWTITDAKDGDVLIRETGEPFIHNGNRGSYLPEFLGAYCGISDGRFRPNGSPYYWGRPSCPATKEQRELLFSKMKEAGCEWDSEKKELKKIEI